MTEFNYDLPTVKFTYKSNKENIMLADLSVYLGTNLLQTYIKPTDKHQYLLIHLHTGPSLNVP